MQNKVVKMSKFWDEPHPPPVAKIHNFFQMICGIVGISGICVLHVASGPIGISKLVVKIS